MTVGRDRGLINDFGSSASTDLPKSNFAKSWESLLPDYNDSSYCDEAISPVPPLPFFQGVAGNSETSRRRHSSFVHTHVMINECIDG